MAEAAIADVKAQLAKIGVTRVILIRHANAAPPGGKAKSSYDTPHDWKQDDQMRPLTDKGKKQAEEARRWFLDGIGLNDNKALITSGARRAAETLQVMAEFRDSSSANVSMLMLPTLHPAGVAPACEEMFDRLGYGPLTKYYAEPNGRQALAEYATVVSSDFAKLIDNLDPTAKGKTICMFGHAVFLNATAMLFADAMGLSESDKKALEGIELGEAEGIWLQQLPDKVILRHLHCKGLAPPGVSDHPLGADM